MQLSETVPGDVHDGGGNRGGDGEERRRYERHGTPAITLDTTLPLPLNTQSFL